MQNFKEYLNENKAQLEKIHSILDELDENEANEFGEFLYYEFLEDDLEEDDLDFFDNDDIRMMIDELGESFYSDILQFLELDGEDEEMEEAVSRILKTGNKNRKKRKFMKNTKADLRKTASKRKKSNRASKADRKRYYRANKNKISAYQKSRGAAIKKGSHKVKKRRSA